MQEYALVEENGAVTWRLIRDDIHVGERKVSQAVTYVVQSIYILLQLMCNFSIVERKCVSPYYQLCWHILHQVFAPANLRAAAENTVYRDLVSQFIVDKYTLRYTGGFVPDVHHILTKV